MPKIVWAVNCGPVTWRMPAVKRRTPMAKKTNHLPIRKTRLAPGVVTSSTTIATIGRTNMMRRMRGRYIGLAPARNRRQAEP
jgi:hypothetical protein